MEYGVVRNPSTLSEVVSVHVCRAKDRGALELGRSPWRTGPASLCPLLVRQDDRSGRSIPWDSVDDHLPSLAVKLAWNWVWDLDLGAPASGPSVTAASSCHFSLWLQHPSEIPRLWLGPLLGAGLFFWSLDGVGPGGVEPLNTGYIGAKAIPRATGYGSPPPRMPRCYQRAALASFGVPRFWARFLSRQGPGGGGRESGRNLGRMAQPRTSCDLSSNDEAG